MSGEEGDFEEDLIKKVIIDVIEANCEPEKNVNVNQFRELSRSILDDLYKELHKLKKLFKYSATVFLQQKVGASLSYGTAMNADNTADGQVCYFYSESKYYDLSISVAGFKITQK